MLCFICNRDISNNLYRCCDHNTCSKYCSDKLMSINIKRDPTLTNHNIWIKDITYYIQPQVIDIYPDIYHNIVIKSKLPIIKTNKNNTPLFSTVFTPLLSGIMVGGDNTLNDRFKNKYLKYKTKYIKLRKTL